MDERVALYKTTYQVFRCHFQRHTQFNPVLQKKENLPSPRNTGLRKPQRLLQLSSEHSLRLSATCRSGRDQGPQPDLWVSTLLPSRPWTLRNWAGSLVSLDLSFLSRHWRRQISVPFLTVMLSSAETCLLLFPLPRTLLPPIST